LVLGFQNHLCVLVHSTAAMVKGANIEDFGGPKKSRSGFFIFADEKRPKIMEEMKKTGKVDVGACGKKIGDMWGKLSDKEKEPYQTKAAKEKAEFEKKMEAFKKSPNYENFMQAKSDKKDDKKQKNEKKEAKKRDREEGKPAKAATAFFIFSNENREKYTQKNAAGKTDIGATAKKIGEVWKTLSADEKAKYDKKAEAAKKQYDKDMAAFTAKKAKKDGSPKKESPKSSPKKTSPKKEQPKSSPKASSPKASAKASPKKESGKKKSG